MHYKKMVRFTTRKDSYFSAITSLQEHTKKNLTQNKTSDILLNNYLYKKCPYNKGPHIQQHTSAYNNYCPIGIT